VFDVSRVILGFGAMSYVEWWLRDYARGMTGQTLEDDEKGVWHRQRWWYSSEAGSNGMKRLILIVTLSLFGATTLAVAHPSASVAFAQKKNKEEKKDPPGPPVIKDKGSRDKPKAPPPKKEKKPS
jgi:hypothetical protein